MRDILLVCGSRDWNDRARLFSECRELARMSGKVAVVLSGGAAGADTLAMEWATDARLPGLLELADWKRDGRAAGPLRNQRMLDVYGQRIVCVAAFFLDDRPCRGTLDMVRRSEKYGLGVFEIHAPRPL